MSDDTKDALDLDELERQCSDPVVLAVSMPDIKRALEHDQYHPEVVTAISSLLLHAPELIRRVRERDEDIAPMKSSIARARSAMSPPSV